MAFQKQELVEDKKRRRYKYENGYKKCFECKQWFPESILYELPRDLWTSLQSPQSLQSLQSPLFLASFGKVLWTKTV